MPESTLSISFTDLQKEIGAFLGYGVDPTAWTNERFAEIDRYIQSGIRQFYYPPAVNGIEAGYEWSFLKPIASLSTVADTATVALPDDLGRIVSDLHYAASVHAVPVAICSEGRYQDLLQQDASTGRPRFATVRHKVSDGTTGQRQEVAFWPTPDAVYTLSYRYEAFAGKLTATKQYPLGGMRHAELILESCLAIAEQRANDEKGLHGERFMALLAAGIAQDRRGGARIYGQMGGRGDSVLSRNALPEHLTMTYKGETW